MGNLITLKKNDNAKHVLSKESVNRVTTHGGRFLISELPTATYLDGEELIEITQNKQSRSVRIDDLVDYIKAQLTS